MFEHSARLQAVKIKSGRTLTEDYLRAAHKAGRIGGGDAMPPWLVYGGDDSFEHLGVQVLGWRSLAAP